MMKQERVMILRGIGIGFILAALFFFAMKDRIMENLRKDITDQEIIERASTLGMIQIKQLEDVYLTDEQVIEKARELGMEFKK
ncbi:MAG: hypothetical protein JW708_10615 [Vallitaleaceae bacterium]|nr:hypothetical protein [Vallitaleaceae bacterium]